MVTNLKYLKNLIHQRVIDVSTGINTIAPLAGEEEILEPTMSIYTQIHFEDYELHVYNKAEIINNVNSSPKEFQGLIVSDVSEEKDFAQLTFNNGWIYRIDLRDEAYSTDPEAMCLYGPNNLCVVWN